MFIFILWIRLEACLFSGRRMSILSIQKCSVPSSILTIKAPVAHFILTVKISLSQDHVMIQRSSLSLIKLGHDRVIILSGDEQELEKGFELVAGLCINADDASCLPTWLAPCCVLPPLMVLQLHQPARNILPSAEHRLWAVRCRMKIQTNIGSPTSGGVHFTKLSLIIICVIFSHFPELTGWSGEGQHPDHLCELNCHVKLHQKKNGNLWTYFLISNLLFLVLRYFSFPCPSDKYTVLPN